MDVDESNAEGSSDLPSSSTVPRPDSPISAPVPSEPVLGLLASSNSNSQAVANTDAGENISNCSSDISAPAYTSSSRSSVQMKPNRTEPNAHSIVNSNETTDASQSGSYQMSLRPNRRRTQREPEVDDLALDKLLEDNRIGNCSQFTPSIDPVEDLEDWVNVERILKVQRTAPLRANRDDAGRDGINSISSTILEYTHFVKFRDQSYWHCNWIPGNTILFMHPSMVKNYHRKHADEVEEADAAYEVDQRETAVPSSDGESASDTEEKENDRREADEHNKPAVTEKTPLIGGRLVLPKIGPQRRRGRRRYFYLITHGVDPHYLYPESVFDVSDAFAATLFSKTKRWKKANKAKGRKNLRSKVRLREVLVKWSHLDAGQATWETVECDLDHLETILPTYSRLGEVPLDPCGRRLLPIHVRRWILQLADAHLSHLAGLYCAHLGSADDARIKEATSKRQPISPRPTTAPKLWNDAWMKSQPCYLSPIEGGVLYPYQLEGVRWLRHSLYQGVNTILADEMGLGKTVQVIAMLYSLYKEDRNPGPFLVVAPLCTVMNWEQEFFFWAPEMHVVVYAGDKSARAMINEFQLFLPNTMNLPAFNVLITTYELFCLEKNLFTPFHWPVLVVDEAHRLRNRQSRLFRDLSILDVGFKILLTGTPLQNNLEELFHLLNFLDPKQFSDSRMLGVEWTDLSKEERISSLHNLLKCHLLRRMKRDVITDLPKKTEIIVPVDLTLLQKRLYKLILMKDYHELRTGNLMNTLIHLQKVCDHPYLMPSGDAIAPRVASGQEAGCYEQQALVQVSSKLHLVMRMLAKLRSEGHRVLIFCHLTKMLDLIEIALVNAGYPFERIDGSVRGTIRQTLIDRFNSKDAEPFVFLLSTRAGGEGINLASADTVILFDSDWNPHCDLQALARAHRIGQSKQVLIYRLIARATVEERILQVSRRKLALTKLIIDPRRKTAVEGAEEEVGGGGSSVAGKRKKARGDPSRLSRSEAHMILKNGLDLLFADDDEGENDLPSLEGSLQSLTTNKPPLPPDTSQPISPTEQDEAASAAVGSEVATEAAKPRLQPLVYSDAALDQLLDRNREADVDEPTREADDYLSIFKSAHFCQDPNRLSITDPVSDPAHAEVSVAERSSSAPQQQSTTDNKNFDPPTVGQKEIADFWDRLLRVRHERVAAADRSEEGDAFRQLTKRPCHSRRSQATHDDESDRHTNSDDSDIELDSVHTATSSGHALLSDARIKTEPSASQAQSRKSRRVPKPTYTSLSNFHRVSRGDDTDERRSRALRGRGRPPQSSAGSRGEALIRTGSENEEEQEEDAVETGDEEGNESTDDGGRGHRRGDSGSSRRGHRDASSCLDDDSEDPNYVPSGSEDVQETAAGRRRRSLQVSAQRRKQGLTSQNSDDVDDVPMVQYHLATLYRTIDWSNAEPVYACWRAMVAALGDEVTWTDDRRMLVYGFNAHDRQMFLDSVMRFGLPPRGILPPQEWLPMALRSKPPVHLFAYTALFMRHLYDDPLVADDNAPEWCDGLPKEGVSGLTVLSRIAMMSLIRNKVIQFEDYNAVPRKHRTHSDNRFRFTIHEGGLTLLSAVWRSELSQMGNRLAEVNARLSCPALEKQRRLFSVIHRNWHHRHDFWLLAGIHVHGYAAWPEIIADRRFSMIPLGLAQHVRPEDSERFSQNLSDIELAEEIRQHFSFSAEVHSFLLHRLRLLEQALLVEQGLFSIALAALSEPDKEPNLAQVMALTSKLSFSLASKGPHKHLSLPPDSHVANAVRNAVKELHLLLEDLYADLPGLPAVLTCDGIDFAHPRFFTISSPPTSRASSVPAGVSSRQDDPHHIQSSSSLTPAPSSILSNAPSDGQPMEHGNYSAKFSEGHGATNSASLERGMIGSLSGPQCVGKQAGPPAVAVVSPLQQNSKTRDHIARKQANALVIDARPITPSGHSIGANRTPTDKAMRIELSRRSMPPELGKTVRPWPTDSLGQQVDNSVIEISDSD